MRLAIASKGREKSGGARVITFVKVVKEKIYLVSFYEKGQLDNQAKDQIIELLKNGWLLIKAISKNSNQ